MAISRVASQDAKGLGSAGTATATYPATPTQGNLLIATAFSNSAADALAISGWTKDVSHQRGTSQTIALFHKLAGAGESTTVTVTGGNTTTRIHIYEYTGAANPVTLDGTNQGAGTSGTSWLSPSITTTYPSDLVMIAMAASTIITNPAFDSSFNLRQADASIRLFDADRIVGATGSYSSTASWTTNSATQGVIAAFKAAAVTGSATIAGTGSVTAATGVHTGVGSASLTGSGSLTVAGIHTAVGTASIAGSGSLTATGLHIAVGAASATGAGSLTATGSHTAQGTATLTGTSGLTATGFVTDLDAADLHGNGALTAAGFKTVYANATLTGLGQVTVAGRATRFAASTLTGNSTANASGLHIAYGTGALHAAGVLTATGDQATTSSVPYGHLQDRWWPTTATVGIATPPPAVIGIARAPGRHEP